MQAQFQYFLVANMLYWIKSLLLAALTISAYLWIQRYQDMYTEDLHASLVTSAPCHIISTLDIIQWYNITHNSSHWNMNHSSTKAILGNNNFLVSVFPVNNFYLFVEVLQNLSRIKIFIWALHYVLC